MWLSGNQTPDFRTINNFRSLHLKGTINRLFRQVVLMWIEKGYISLQTVYIDYENGITCRALHIVTQLDFTKNAA